MSAAITVQARKCAPSSTVNTAIATRVDWVMAVRMAVSDLVRLLEEVSGVHVAFKRFQEREVHLPMRQPRDWSYKFDTIFNSVADCDTSDIAGCAPGLVCGVNNCAKFHQISVATGFFDTSDCCEGKRWRGTPGL